MVTEENILFSSKILIQNEIFGIFPDRTDILDFWANLFLIFVGLAGNNFIPDY